MSEYRTSAADVDADETTKPAGRMRLLPTVTFAVRASALARVALPVALVTAGLVAGGPAAGAENLITMDTTCCPGEG
jgi:hypothetical protein